jgi:hypothetical protein
MTLQQLAGAILQAYHKPTNQVAHVLVDVFSWMTWEGFLAEDIPAEDAEELDLCIVGPDWWFTWIGDSHTLVYEEPPKQPNYRLESLSQYLANEEDPR